MKQAVYAGTFDPVTFGHLDVAARAAQVFDRLTIAVAQDTGKKLMFRLAERVDLARGCMAHLQNVEVTPFSGLLVDWARSRGIYTLIRGLRAFSDFEYEFQMALTNRKLAPDIETMFLMPNEEFSYISSSMVREIAALGGAVEQFVPAPVAAALKKKLIVP
ncbi:MAG: pantetheine-phosphate adenylyltransferase [Kiritimatiellae bacterium]|jgi:pantetheine-phosphate adenylyltransferase|nr:pantetheine-phosphate adenylyltransferase [Kiritimatiellia bacterium]NLD90253.1 pantetheine-phosphate adenylyltransferase [Lentisphaerota bacterium]HOU21683.1 pantetheine-phosphate adenylyltransferase [Kiritimatiellia bacterium]HPC18762.1 pantetheine-phosphate adenylyltransferase [Kiritimatiellia bacterium]HQN80636.1 pantetheine-phosphate adenylyltransferase [Kiritimatiellia bacterium]